MEPAASLALPPTPSSLLPGSPQGFPSSDRNSQRHRDLLAAFSWFSRLRFQLGLSGELLKVPRAGNAGCVLWDVGHLSPGEAKGDLGVKYPLPRFWEVPVSLPFPLALLLKKQRWVRGGRGDRGSFSLRAQPGVEALLSLV